MQNQKQTVCEPLKQSTKNNFQLYDSQTAKEIQARWDWKQAYRVLKSDEKLDQTDIAIVSHIVKNCLKRIKSNETPIARLTRQSILDGIIKFPSIKLKTTNAVTKRFKNLSHIVKPFKSIGKKRADHKINNYLINFTYFFSCEKAQKRGEEKELFSHENHLTITRQSPDRLPALPVQESERRSKKKASYSSNFSRSFKISTTVLDPRPGPIENSQKVIELEKKLAEKDNILKIQDDRLKEATKQIAILRRKLNEKKDFVVGESEKSFQKKESPENTASHRNQTEEEADRVRKDFEKLLDENKAFVEKLSISKNDIIRLATQEKADSDKLLLALEQLYGSKSAIKNPIGFFRSMFKPNNNIIFTQAGLFARLRNSNNCSEKAVKPVDESRELAKKKIQALYLSNYDLFKENAKNFSMKYTMSYFLDDVDHTDSFLDELLGTFSSRQAAFLKEWEGEKL